MLGIHKTEAEPIAGSKPEATGLDGYLDYLGIPKQDYANEPTGETISSDPFPDDNASPETERPNGYNPDSYYQPDEIKTMENNITFSMIPAESLVEVVDIGMVKGAELIAKEPQEGATDEEKAKLTKIWALFLAGKNANISPGWMLLAMILLIYGPKFFTAFQIRKAKNEAEAANKKAEKERIRAEKAEAEAAELRKQSTQQEIDEHIRRAVMDAMKSQNPASAIIEDVTAGAQPSEPAPKPRGRKPKNSGKKK